MRNGADVEPGRRTRFLAGDRRALRARVGDELEAALRLRIEPGEVEVRIEDVRVFDLRDRGRTALIPRRLRRTGRADVAAELDLVAAIAGERQAVVGRELCVQLGVRRLQRGVVGDAVRGEEVRGAGL